MVFKPVSNDRAVTLACVEFWTSDYLLLWKDLKGDQHFSFKTKCDTF